MSVSRSLGSNEGHTTNAARPRLPHPLAAGSSNQRSGGELTFPLRDVVPSRLSGGRP